MAQLGKEYACNVGDLGLIPGLGRSPGEEKGYPIQYSGLDYFMGCIVHGVTKSQTQLSNFHFSRLLSGLLAKTLLESCKDFRDTFSKILIFG